MRRAAFFFFPFFCRTMCEIKERLCQKEKKNLMNLRALRRPQSAAHDSEPDYEA